jgi:hypothetical protein
MSVEDVEQIMDDARDGVEYANVCRYSFNPRSSHLRKSTRLWLGSLRQRSKLESGPHWDIQDESAVEDEFDALFGDLLQDKSNQEIVAAAPAPPVNEVDFPAVPTTTTIDDLLAEENQAEGRIFFTSSLFDLSETRQPELVAS